MDRINLRQFMIIVFLLAIAMKMFMLPTYMMRVSGEDSFEVMVLESIIDLVLLVVVILIVKNGKGSFVETLQFALGKVFAKIIAALFSLFYICKLFLMLSELQTFFSTAVLYAPLSPLHIVPLMLLLIFVSGKKLSVLGRVGEVIAPLVILSMFVMGALSIKSIDFTNLLPFFSDPENIRKGLMSFPMWFGDFTLLLVYTGKTDGRRRIWFALIAAVIGLAVLTFFSAMMFSLYANVPQVLTYGHNISNMTQYSVSSFKFGRFDLLVFCIWLLGVLMASSIMVTFINRCINFTISKDVGYYTAIICSTFIIASMFIFNNANKISEFVITWFALPAAIIQYGFPLIILIALMLRRIPGRSRYKNITPNVKQEGRHS